jgi:hypothetical protein
MDIFEITYRLKLRELTSFLKYMKTYSEQNRDEIAQEAIEPLTPLVERNEK